MKFHFWRILALLPGVAVAWMAAPGPVSAQDKLTFCRSYANTAVSQNQENERLDCGFTGARWTSDAGNHFGWCMRASRDQVNAETNTRTRQINACRRDRGDRSKRDFCRDYANAAVSRNQENERLDCGFTGARWASDAGNHFNWCMRASRDQANAETNTRTRQISACRRDRGDRSKRDFCRDYANAAVSRIQENERLDCGFTGARWASSDARSHFNWCMRASRDQANAETNTRTRQINACRRDRGDRSKRDFCRDYANAAVSRIQENERLDCGFTGARWASSDARSHFNWCMRASRDQVNAETNARTEQIRECRDRRGGDRTNRDFCRDYANAAVSRNRENERLDCGFTGARWTSDAGNHFNWCMRASRGQANAETNARTRQINACRRDRGDGRRGSCDLRDARLTVRSPGCDRSVAIPFDRARLPDGAALRQAINTGVIGSGRPPYGECNFHTDIVYRCRGGRLVIDRVFECRQNRSGEQGADCSVSD